MGGSIYERPVALQAAPACGELSMPLRLTLSKQSNNHELTLSLLVLSNTLSVVGGLAGLAGSPLSLVIWSGVKSSLMMRSRAAKSSFAVS